MAARPTLVVGALRTSGNPVMKGSALLWDNPTGLSTTDAHVILQCSMVKGALDPETYGVALGVGSADADIEWLWTARIVAISYPPSNNPSWTAKIASWSFTIAPGPYPNLDLAVLQVLGPLKWGFSKPLIESFSDHRLEALPLGDSDLASVGLAVRVYGFGQSSSHSTQRAAMTGGIISRKTDQTITIDAGMLGGHSGGMLLEPAGKVMGWCVWSQTDKVGKTSLSTPSGLNDARPINLLRPALEAALFAIDPSRTGATLEEKLQGAVPLPVQNQPLIDPEGAATVRRLAKRKAALLEAEAHAGPRGPVDSATEEAIKNGLKNLSASISEGVSRSVPLHVPTLFLLERCNLTRVHLYSDDIASILKVLALKIERLAMDIHPQAEVNHFGVVDSGYGEWMNSLELELTYAGDCGKLETYDDLPLSPEKVVRSAARSLVHQQKDSATVYFSNYHVNSLEDGMIGFTKLVQKISKEMHAQLGFDLDCYSTRANPFDKASLSEHRHLVYYKVSRGQ